MRKKMNNPLVITGLIAAFALGYGVRFVDGSTAKIGELEARLAVEEQQNASLANQLEDVLSGIAPAAGQAEEAASQDEAQAADEAQGEAPAADEEAAAAPAEAPVDETTTIE